MGIDIELESNNTNIEITSNNDVIIEHTSGNVLSKKNTEYETTFVKKEYKLVGDNVFVPSSYENSPQWLRDTITNTIEFSLNQKINEINLLANSLSGLIDELNVAKNAYTNSIISSADIDERINARIETLNSSLSGSDATIVDLIATMATPEMASAIATNVLSASINDGAIKSLVGSLQTAISTNSETLANNIDIVHSEMTGEIEASSEARQVISSKIGIDPSSLEENGTGLLARMSLIENQIDGVIETVLGEHDVITYNTVDGEIDPNSLEIIRTAEPYASWIGLETPGSENVRLSHIGDTYIKYTIGIDGLKSYKGSFKFIKTAVDDTSPFGTDEQGFTWAKIVDQVSEEVYMTALNAKDLADSKRRVFVNNPFVPYDEGDLWLVQAGNVIVGTSISGVVVQAGDILRCLESKTSSGLYENNDWVFANNYRQSINAIQVDLNNWRTGEYSTFVTNIQSQVDGKSETYYQPSVPTGRINSINVVANSTLDKYVGDLWKNTYVGTIGGYLGNNTEYVYTKTANGSKWDYKWTKMEVPDIVFDTIDTKKSIYSGNSIPVAIAPDVIELNDMWITGSAPVSGYDKESIYVWNGIAWAKPLKYTDDTSVTILSTGLANGTVTLNLANATINGSKSLSTYVAEEIDKEVVVYSGSNHNTQTGMKVNDIYIEKTTAVGSSGISVDVVNTWKYNGTSWIQIGNNNNLTALADRTDGKRTIYSGGSLPANSALNPLRPNDLFIPTATFTASSVVYTLNEMYRYNGTSWEKATRYDEIKSLLSAQIDNKIETTYGGATPPYANKTNVAKDSKGGDYWYCDTNGSYTKGNIYKYAETANGSNFNYTWVLSSDISKGAFDLADKKRIIFGNAGSSVPTVAQGLAISDIWIPSSNGGIYISGKVYKCTSISPVTFIEVDYTNDEVINGIIDGTTPLDPNIITIGDSSTTFLEYLTAEIDKKVAIYSGETAPVAGQPIGVAINDIYLWFTTASKVLANGTTQVYNITRTYKYSGSAWAEITTNSNITALADLADGKRTVFSGNTVPIGAVTRDLWIPSANNGSYIAGEIYQYSGTAWVIATKYTEDLDAFVDVINPKVVTLQNQVDGKIEYFFYEKYNQASTIIASATSESNALDIIDNQWNTQALKEAATGNVVYFKNTKNGYWYSGSTNSWSVLSDTSMMQALGKAESAQATADGKITIYSAQYSASAPSGSEGKFWYDKNVAKLKQYQSGAWVILSVSTTPKLSNGDLVYVYGATGANISENTGYRYVTGVTPVWVSILDGKITATAQAVTNLDAKITDPVTGSIVVATNAVKQELIATVIPNGDKAVESKWAYNSNIVMDGNTYSSGFGIVSNVVGNAGSTPRPTSGSEFWVNADKFKIISTNQSAVSKNPFTVNASTGEIDFNGKVSFTNIKDDAAKTALLGSITNAQNTANSAITELADIASDNKLTPDEKIATQKEWDIIVSEYSKNTTQASAYSVSSTAYTNAYNTLNTYITPLLSSLTTTSTIVGTTFRNNFKAYYDARTDLLNAIATKISTNATTTTNTAIVSNNDVFAQKLGYANYSAMVAAAASGKTIINGGYINTDLIQANAINAGMINTTGLIAENISANEINGITINGGVINGARINGAVIKASYLDLDGELEVLTNYHISVAMYNASPSTYSDSIYISADNEYRIPSMSSVTGPNLQGFYTPASFPYSPRAYTSNIYAYNIANVGSNSKAVKSRPSINFDYSGVAGGTKIFYGRNSTEFYIKIGSLYLIRCLWGADGSNCTVSGMGATVTVGPYEVGHYYALGIDFTVQKYATNQSVSVQNNFSLTLASDWNTPGGIITGCISGEIGTLYHPKITINNMI